MGNIEYDFQKIEKKWQNKWQKEKIFEVKEDLSKWKRKILCTRDVSISKF